MAYDMMPRWMKDIYRLVLEHSVSVDKICVHVVDDNIYINLIPYFDYRQEKLYSLQSYLDNLKRNGQ